MKITREHIARIQAARAEEDLARLPASLSVEAMPERYTPDGVQRSVELALGNLIVALGEQGQRKKGRR